MSFLPTGMPIDHEAHSDGELPSSFSSDKEGGNEKELSNLESSRRSVVFFSEDELVEETLNGVFVQVGNVEYNKIMQQKNRRTSLVTDLATGREGGARGQLAQLRTTYTMPQSPANRKRKSIMNRLRDEHGGELPDMDSQEETGIPSTPSTRLFKQGRYLIASKIVVSHDPHNVTHKQYCLQAVPAAKTRCQKILLYGLNFEEYSIRSIHWMFRQSFLVVFVTAFIGFFSLTLVFGFWIWMIGLYQPYCIMGPQGNETLKEKFMDAFVLSWTTFSTVGYGAIQPKISSDEGIDDVHKCFFITAICSFEAFVGVIFGSICGAILHIKVSRVQSFAQVTFSDIVCVRYGSGLRVQTSNDDDHSVDSEEDLESYPCPILEFRVANRMHSVVGGEIIDCTVNVAATIEAPQACQNESAQRHCRKKDRGRTTVRKKQISGISRGGMMGISDLTADTAGPTLAVEEDLTGSMVSKRIIKKLECQSHNHPFFKRIFVLRHTIDHHSPLLTPVARELVKRNAGLWPREMNNAESVRKALQFERLLVSLSGTSNANAKAVYAHNVYEYVDLHVGYRFVNMLYRDKREGDLRVDIGLINDITEQAGVVVRICPMGKW